MTLAQLLATYPRHARRIRAMDAAGIAIELIEKAVRDLDGRRSSATPARPAPTPRGATRRYVPTSDAMLRRTVEVRAAVIDAESRTVELTASSEYAAERWGETEILSHDDGAVRLERLRALGAMHLDHDSAQRVAKVLSAEIKGRKLVLRVQFGRTDLAKDAFLDVQDGILRGVSVGYRVHEWNVDDDTNTWTAIDWEPYEASFTTIPVDPTVGVGRSAELELAWRSVTRPSTASITPITTRGAAAARPQERHMTLAQLLAKYSRHADSIRSMNAAGIALDLIEKAMQDLETRAADLDDTAEVDDETEVEATPATPKRRSAKGSAAAGAAADALAVREGKNQAARIVAMARAMGLGDKAEGYIASESFEDACDQMQRDFAKAKKDAQSTHDVRVPSLEVTADRADKAFASAVDALSHRFNHHDRTVTVQNDMRGRSVLQLCSDVAMALGHSDAGRWSKRELAAWALGIKSHEFGMRSAYYSSGNFSTFVLAAYVDKTLLKAFNDYQPTWPTWGVERYVDDFKPFASGALDVGVLIEKAEGIPAQLLQVDEAGYNSSLGLFSGVLAFTLQALVNDDLGQIDRMIMKTGSNGALTMEREAVKALISYDYTTNGNEITTSPLATAGNIDKARKIMTEQKGPGGQMLGKPARYLLHPAGLRETAVQQTQQGPGSTTRNANLDITPVPVALLNDTTIHANAAADTWYLTADPATSDTVVVARLTGWQAPKAFEKDGGMIPQRNMLILLPLRAVHAGKYSSVRAKAS